MIDANWKGMMAMAQARRFHGASGLGLLVVLLLGWPGLVCGQAAAPAPAAVDPAAWQVPPLNTHPLASCLPEELARLRAAWAAGEPTRTPLVAMVKRAEGYLKEELFIPPRGGQHDRWYRCEKCQVSLQTRDGAHVCPVCKTAYTGQLFEDVKFNERHDRNFQLLHACAWAWALTGEARYAERATALLLGYADKYSQYEYHSTVSPNLNPLNMLYHLKSGARIYSQTLEEGVAMCRWIAPAYDLLHDGAGLTPEQHQRIREGLFRPMLKTIDGYKMDKVNWQTFHNAALLLGGAVIGDEALVKKAIYDPANGILFQINNSLTADGKWYEDSWAYHFYAMDAMTMGVEGARRLGLNLWSHPRLLGSFTLPVYYTLPDGTLPRFGDSHSVGARNRSGLALSAYLTTREPALLPLLPDKPTWDTLMLGYEPQPGAAAPTLGSLVYEAAGHAVLRTGGEAGLSTVMTFAPYGGYHAHLDKLSFVFYGYGKELGVDPGRGQTYHLPVHKEWNRGTISHNTVVVDRAPQLGADGERELFVATPDYAAVAASAKGVYAGVTHRRLLVQGPGWLLVADELQASTERRFDWAYHNRGKEALTDLATTEVNTETWPGTGWNFIKNARLGRSDEPVRVRFPLAPATTHVLAAAAPGTEILLGDGPGGNMTERVPLVVLGRSGKTAHFAVLLVPVKGDAAPALPPPVSEPGTTGWTIHLGEGAERLTVVWSPGALRLSKGAEVLLSTPAN